MSVSNAGSPARTISLDVVLSSIRLPRGFNLRDEADLADDDVLDLGASIKQKGLLTPLLVREIPGQKGCYELVSGFRRFVAMRAVGLRGTVPVRCTTFADAADASLTNMIENSARKGVHTADLAKRLYEFDRGTYPGVALAPDGSGAVPIPRDAVCAQTSLSPTYVGNLIRAWGKLCDKLRREWRRKDVPTDVMVGLAKFKTEEEQVAAYEAWRTEIAEAAEKKAARRANKKAGGGGDGDGEGEDGEPAEDAGPRKKKTILEQLAKFQARYDREVLPARERDVAEAKMETLKWVLRERKKLTFT